MFLYNGNMSHNQFGIYFKSSRIEAGLNETTEITTESYRVDTDIFGLIKMTPI